MIMLKHLFQWLNLQQSVSLLSRQNLVRVVNLCHRSVNAAAVIHKLFTHLIELNGLEIVNKSYYFAITCGADPVDCSIRSLCSDKKTSRSRHQIWSIFLNKTGCLTRLTMMDALFIHRKQPLDGHYIPGMSRILSYTHSD